MDNPMPGLKGDRYRRTVTAILLAAVVALFAAVVFAEGVAEAKGGGRGGGGGGKPSSNSPSKPSGGGGGSPAKSGPQTRIQDSSSLYYGSPNYGIRHGRMSNFFLWAWIFHDFDDEYEEEYIQSNYGFGGWAVLGVGAVGTFLLIRTVRRRSGV